MTPQEAHDVEIAVMQDAMVRQARVLSIAVKALSRIAQSSGEMAPTLRSYAQEALQGVAVAAFNNEG